MTQQSLSNADDDTLRDRVRTVVGEHAGIVTPMDQVGDGDDLYALGMSSHASVSVMLALEDDMGLQFPDEALTRSTFQSVDAIVHSLGDLRER